MRKFIKLFITLLGIAALIGAALYFLVNILKKYYLEDYDDEDFDNDFFDEEVERDYVTLGKTDGKKVAEKEAETVKDSEEDLEVFSSGLDDENISLDESDESGEDVATATV